MISFASLRSHPKVTLPSVDNGWLINSSIVKDPPRSITTRRIDKVGDTQMVVDMIEDNGSRICGNIEKFPRGVNPAGEYASSSSFSTCDAPYVVPGPASTIRDNTNNPPRLRTDAGALFRNQYTRGGNGYLPRRLMMYSGAFRPPILTQEQLMPLSRQPRIRTSCITHPEKINYRATCGQTNLDFAKNIKELAIQPVNCHPTVRKIVEIGGKQTEDLSKFIQTEGVTIKNVSAGVRPRDITIQEGLKCPAVTQIRPTTAYAHTTPCSEGITRDSMLYVMEKPTSFIRDELMRSGPLVPNARFNEKHGTLVDSTNVDRWILEYPRNGTGEPVVCAPNRSGMMLPATEIDTRFYLHDDIRQQCENVIARPCDDRQVSMPIPADLTHFVRDEIVAAQDVIGAPTMDSLVAYGIADHSTVDTQRYTNSDMLHYDTHAGVHGSTRITKRLDEAADFGRVKILVDSLHADAATQCTFGEKTTHMHSRDDSMQKKRIVKQFVKDSGRLTSQFDDPQLAQRRVRLNPTLDMSGYSVSNVGCVPMTSDRVGAVPINGSIGSGKFKDRVRNVYDSRREALVY